MGIGGNVRRLRAAPAFAIATLVTVALSMVLLTAGPVFSDAVAVGALRKSLIEEPAATTVVSVTSRSDVVDVPEVEEVIERAVRRSFGDIDHTSWSSLVSNDSFELPDQPSAERVDLVGFAWLDALDEHVTVVDGRLPDDSSDVVEIAVSERAALELGLDIDRDLAVVRRTGAGDERTVRVVGHYTIDDPTAAFWVGRDRISEAVGSTAAFRTVTALTTRRSLLAVTERTEIGLVTAPRFESIEPSDVSPLRSRISRLPGAAANELARASIDSATDIEVSTSAPTVLIGAGRTLTVARSIVFAVTLQLAALAAFALVLVGGLGVDRRHAELAVLRERGASATQLVAQSTLDASLVVFPVAAVAPFVARWLVSTLDDVGPLADTGIVLEPEIGSLAWTVVVGAAIVSVALLAWPALRAARARDASSSRSSRRRFGGVLQRSGVDVALALLALVTYWQLRTLGDDRAASVRGRFGVDPLVIVAPTLGLATGAFLALRVVPAAARWAERSVVGTRGAAPALTGWQLARRPHRYARSALLLIMSLAIGTFAVAYDATWTVSQQAQAAHEIGADGRVEPNRRTGDSVGPMQLPSLIEQVPGVDVVTPVVKGSVELPGSDRGGAFVAVAADRSEALGESIEAGVAAAMASLRDARADVAGLGLPAGARGIELSVSVSDPDATADPPSVADGAEPTSDDDAAETPPPPEPFVASLAVVIVDRGGTPRRLDAGLIEPGANSVEIPLAIGGASGFEASPSGPVSLTGFEISTTSQPTPPREVAITLGPLVIDTGDSAGVMLPVLQSSFVTETDVLGFVDGRPAIGFGGDAPDDGVGLTVTTGSASFGTVPIIHGVVVRDAEFPTEVPAAATSTWLTASRTEIGDVVPVSLGRADDVRIRIVASVDAVPTVDPALVDGLLVDLPSLMAVEYRPGQTEREMTEYWFSVDPDTELSPGALLEPPVSATAVELTADRAEELVDNAAALGAIGALSLGFVAAAAFAVVGFAVTTMVSVSERRSEFRLLRAIGLTGRQHRRWMLAEQSLLALVGIGLGVLLGWLLAVMILPVVSLAQDGSEVYPPVEAVVPWARVTVLILAVVVGLLLGAVFTATHDRRAPGEAMRAGGDT